MKKPPLRSFRVKNFKAIKDSKNVRFGWLTVFIGNNGAGKSSLIEALETFRDTVLDGVDTAFRRWRGFEHVLNKSHNRSKIIKPPNCRDSYPHPMEFNFHWNSKNQDLKCRQTITLGSAENTLFIQHEHITEQHENPKKIWTREDNGNILEQFKPSSLPKLSDGKSLIKEFVRTSFERWQFLMLNPEIIGQPTPQRRATNRIELSKDGSNVAEYLNEIKNLNLDTFNEIVESLRYVLPYAVDLQPTLASELERAFYLKLKEQSYEIPGWLLSTGTLRIVAILACLRHPNPPPLLVIEEIENGLDPRTLHLVVEEIRSAIAAGTTQVIFTTHSPYLLDLLDLSQIVVVERKNGQPTFHRPDVDQLAQWSKSFSPGKLYTFGRLTGMDQ